MLRGMSFRSKVRLMAETEARSSASSETIFGWTLQKMKYNDPQEV